MAKFDGWRARLGVIYPSSGLADMEYYRLCPPGVSLHLTRSSVPNDGGVTLDDVVEVARGAQFASLAADLATVRPHAIAWMCTSGSFSRGHSWDAELRRTLAQHAHCPATTTSTAMLAALAALGARRVAVAAPYEPRVLALLTSYLEEAGFEVVAADGLGLVTDWEISNLGLNELAGLVRSVDHPDADAVFLSDTCLMLSPIAAELEADLGKPVVSANMVTMWHALRLAGIGGELPGLAALSRVSQAREPPQRGRVVGDSVVSREGVRP